MTVIFASVLILANILNLHIGENETNKKICIDNDLNVESSAYPAKF